MSANSVQERLIPFLGSVFPPVEAQSLECCKGIKVFPALFIISRIVTINSNQYQTTAEPCVVMAIPYTVAPSQPWLKCVHVRLHVRAIVGCIIHSCCCSSACAVDHAQWAELVESQVRGQEQVLSPECCIVIQMFQSLTPSFLLGSPLPLPLPLSPLLPSPLSSLPPPSSVPPLPLSPLLGSPSPSPLPLSPLLGSPSPLPLPPPPSLAPG